MGDERVHFDIALALADVSVNFDAPEDLFCDGGGRLFDSIEVAVDDDLGANMLTGDRPAMPVYTCANTDPPLAVLALPSPSMGIAFQLWPSALVLCRFLERMPADPSGTQLFVWRYADLSVIQAPFRGRARGASSSSARDLAPSGYSRRCWAPRAYSSRICRRSAPTCKKTLMPMSPCTPSSSVRLRSCHSFC